MNSFKSIILLLCLVLLIACKPGKSDQKHSQSPVDGKSEISGNITISGAYALFPLVKKLSSDFMKIHPSVKIVVTEASTGIGIDDLLAKRCQLAMISRPLRDEEESEDIWVVPVAKEGVAPIVNQSNPYIKTILEHGIDPQKLIKLFTGNEQMTWGEMLDIASKERVIAFTRADESGAATVWANFLWKEGTDLKGIKVTGDEEMIRSIQGNKLAIGYCNFAYAFDSSGERTKDIQVMPIDLDFDKTIDWKEIPFVNINKAHRALWLGYYPKNLTRELTLGSLGKPTDPAILEFLRYILTNGQDEVATLGLCELNDVYIKKSLDTLR